MKNIAITSAATVLMTTAAFSADEASITYAAPGLDEQVTIDGMSTTQTISLGKHFEYELSGVEWQLGSGDPGNGWNGGNGNFNKVDNSWPTGSASLSVTVNGKSVLSGASLSTTNIGTSAGSSITFDEPVIISDDTVDIVITYKTDMPGQSATFVSIKGTCLKDPPIPTGDLEVSPIVREGATPQVYWAISREGVYGTTPAISVDGPAVGAHLESKFVGSESGSTESSDAPNAAKNHTNNGHGNNLDGVDVSNPGKSAEKWAARGIIDESGAFDDEAKGGGAAPSL